jgi:hypothetical protein
MAEVYAKIQGTYTTTGRPRAAGRGTDRPWID